MSKVIVIGSQKGGVGKTTTNAESGIILFAVWERRFLPLISTVRQISAPVMALRIQRTWNIRLDIC